MFQRRVLRLLICQHSMPYIHNIIITILPVFRVVCAISSRQWSLSMKRQRPCTVANDEYQTKYLLSFSFLFFGNLHETWLVRFAQQRSYRQKYDAHKQKTSGIKIIIQLIHKILSYKLTDTLKSCFDSRNTLTILNYTNEAIWCSTKSDLALSVP